MHAFQRAAAAACALIVSTGCAGAGGRGTGLATSIDAEKMPAVGYGTKAPLEPGKVTRAGEAPATPAVGYGKTAPLEVGQINTPAPALAAFAPLVGRTWRGASTNPDATEIDVQRYEWALGGAAVRALHVSGDGATGGETLIYEDKTDGLAFVYVSTDGFSRKGLIDVARDGSFTIVEEDGQRSTAYLDKAGQLVMTTPEGTFVYRADPSASVSFAPAGS